MRLRDVALTDVDAYVRMRCDPVMMAELGGPLAREGIEDKVRRDVRDAAGDTSWIKIIEAEDGLAGQVTLWSHGSISEIGWMVLPEFQGRGIAKAAVRMLLERAREEDRWGLVHAFPGATNGPSNGVCRSLGFWLVGEEIVRFSGRSLRANHWVIDPRDLKEA